MSITASTVAALVATLTVTGPPPGAAASGDGLAPFHRQRVAWHACQDGPDDEVGRDLDAAGARCAEVRVPLDYARPRGRTITVAISRLAATDPARRRGVLLTNPGGPGGPGLVMPLVLAGAGFASRYDVIGMDPRFVGRSTPIDCGWPVSTWLRGAGPDRRTFATGVAVARDLAERCGRTGRDLLPYASTRNTARDLDVVRAALGERRLSYFGWSYGTYLGSVYLQLFPGRADRFVLDSAVDPDVFGPALFRPNDAAITAALVAWARWAARHDASYHLGATTGRVLATVESIRRAADRRPLRVGAYTVDSTMLPLLFWVTADVEETYAVQAAAVRVLRDAALGRAVTPTPELAAFLDDVTSPDATGVRSAQAAIVCADRAASRDPGTYWRDVQRHRAAEPLFGPLIRNVTPCAFWPVRPLEPPTRISNGVPALILNATGDTQTAYAGARALHRALTGSRLVTLTDAHLHGVYFAGSTCADRAVDGYLRDGVLPRADLTCTRDAAAGTPAARSLLQTLSVLTNVSEHAQMVRH
jgi:pimeloyl-ACP methyl ester carboxylesterase